jgi:hypothetical protein
MGKVIVIDFRRRIRIPDYDEQRYGQAGDTSEILWKTAPWAMMIICGITMAISMLLSSFYHHIPLVISVSLWR